MPSYEIFGRFYDAVMGDRAESAKQVSELLRVSKPSARKVLELGCGTGSILKHLQDSYEVSGLDLSNKMLSIARKKVPRAKLWHQDMVDFQIDEQFDTVLCVFDSINHVRRFSDWKRVFARVRQHLSPGGCFIFDINTQRKLERLIAEPPWVHCSLLQQLIECQLSARDLCRNTGNHSAQKRAVPGFQAQKDAVRNLERTVVVHGKRGIGNLPAPILAGGN